MTPFFAYITPDAPDSVCKSEDGPCSKIATTCPQFSQHAEWFSSIENLARSGRIKSAAEQPGVFSALELWPGGEPRVNFKQSVQFVIASGGRTTRRQMESRFGAQPCYKSERF
jgi:hypothetical protein